MNCRNLLRVVISKIAYRISSPISSGSDEGRVAQNVLHQMTNEISSPPYAHAGFTRRIRITVTRERWDNAIETVAWVAPVRSGIRQRWNDFKHFRERAGPSMYEHQRNRTRSLSFLVNKMKLESFNVGAKLAELIQLGFLEPPIKLLFPISGKLLEIGEVGALAPPRIGDFSWPSGPSESFPQIQQI